jgi:pimeloyl-ACP methyl ester carboxylesterase
MTDIRTLIGGSPVSEDMDIPQRRVVNGVDVAYRRAGIGEPLLFMHGMGLTRRWLDLYAALAEDFDVIVPEHPGFGDTARPAWYRGLDDVALHHADFLTDLGLDSVHVVGHSLGGRIAASFAAIFPERVRSLTLIAPAPLATVTPPEEEQEPPPGFDLDGVLFNDNQHAYPDFCDGDDEGLVVAPADGDLYADPSAWSLDTSPTLYRRLARVRCPAQILVPDEDRLIPRESFDAWSRWLGDAAVVTIPGVEHPTGHLLIVQEPRAIADVVCTFAEVAWRSEA